LCKKAGIPRCSIPAYGLALVGATLGVVSFEVWLQTPGGQAFLAHVTGRDNPWDDSDSRLQSPAPVNVPTPTFLDWCMESRGRERGATGGSSGTRTDNPYKHCKQDPDDPNFIICVDHQTGKKERKKKPADWPNGNSK